MRTIAAASLLSLALAAPLKKRDDGGFLAPLSVQGETIDDSYIVVFKKDVKTDQIALHLGSVEESHGMDVSISTCALGGKHAPSLLVDGGRKAM
jgi:cerevisin